MASSPVTSPWVATILKMHGRRFHSLVPLSGYGLRSPLEEVRAKAGSAAAPAATCKNVRRRNFMEAPLMHGMRTRMPDQLATDDGSTSASCGGAPKDKSVTSECLPAEGIVAAKQGG